jgi:hypothetical protein
VQWPGYDTWQRDLLEEFTSELKAGMQITREILAGLIAKEYQMFALVCPLLQMIYPSEGRLTYFALGMR